MVPTVDTNPGEREDETTQNSDMTSCLRTGVQRRPSFRRRQLHSRSLPSLALRTEAKRCVEKRRRKVEPTQTLLFLGIVQYCRDILGGLVWNNWDTRPTDPVFRLFSMVSSDSKVRIWKLILLIGALVKTTVLHFSADLVFKLTRALYSRKDLTCFVQRGLLLTLCGATNATLTKYVQARLQILYCTKLTTTVHEEYFKNHRYYHISQTLPPKLAIRDAEERLSREIGSISGRLAVFTHQIIAAFPTIIWFTFRLWRKAGPRLALLPHLYLFVAYEISQRIFPKNIGSLHRKNAVALSEYRQTGSMVQQHAEVIAALNGEQQEATILREKMQKVVHGEQILATAQFKFDLTFKLAYTYGFRPWISLAIMAFLVRFGSHQADKLADLRLIYQYMMEMLIANGTLLTMHATHRHVQGLAKRVIDFIERLKDLTPAAAHIVESPYIEFADVDVVTPTGNLLVKRLSFQVKNGDALLLTGHNGAGKSSIFRCLGGLWPVVGQISKPRGLDVFYLPQKPYNIHGTLKAQITYPKSPDELSDSDLGYLLEDVDLSHLLQHDGENKVVSWEKQLSLGEQQRLAICRLFFHRPRFAVLDECTSAVPTDVEEHLYESLQKYKIAYITICHRPALKRFHQQNLHLTGDGLGGWTMTEISAAERTYAKKAEISKVKRTTGLGDDPAPPPPIVKRFVLSKVALLFRVMAPRAKSQLSLLFFMVLLRSVMREIGARLLGRMVKGLIAQDVMMLVTTAFLNFGSDIMSAITEDFRVLYEKRLVSDWYKNLSNHWQDKWLSRRKFYTLQQIDKRILDADQRGVIEIREVCDQVAALFGTVLVPLADLIWFGLRLRTYLGPRGILLLGAYNVGCGVLLRLCLPDYKSLIRREKELESAYRLDHTRLRDHAESIAFFQGDAMEKERCDSSFDLLSKQLMYRQNKEHIYKWCTSMISRDAPGTTSSHFFGVPDLVNVSLQQLQLGRSDTDWARSSWYTEAAVRQSIDACASLVGSSANVMRLLATSDRLADLLDILDQEDGALVYPVSVSDIIQFEQVEIKTPGNGLILAKELSFKCETLLVTGPNGSGKTSLFRVLSGLWPTRGHICRPDPLFLAPQTPYMAQGSLRDQISYPIKLTPSQCSDVRYDVCLRSALARVDLKFLIEREGWDAEKRWGEVLSLGEQQRICLARVFFHQPRQVVLDECTSAIAADSELSLYERLQDDNIKMITLSQRLAVPLRKFHDIQVSLGEPGPTAYRIDDFRNT